MLNYTNELAPPNISDFCKQRGGGREEGVAVAAAEGRVIRYIATEREKYWTLLNLKRKKKEKLKTYEGKVVEVITHWAAGTELSMLNGVVIRAEDDTSHRLIDWWVWSSSLVLGIVLALLVLNLLQPPPQPLGETAALGWLDSRRSEVLQWAALRFLLMRPILPDLTLSLVKHVITVRVFSLFFSPLSHFIFFSGPSSGTPSMLTLYFTASFVWCAFFFLATLNIKTRWHVLLCWAVSTNCLQYLGLSQ